MSAAYEYDKWTYEDYLSFERSSETRHEFYRGQVYAMSGGTREHTLISSNLNRHLGNQLADKPCETYTSDLLIASRPQKAAFYPDVSVVCGEPELEWDKGDVLLNPTLVIEVLSDSTQSKDYAIKLPVYQAMPSVQEILYVRQDRVHITQWRRDGDDWPTLFYRALTDTITLASVGCTLTLADIYTRITFDSTDAPPAP